MPIIQSIATAVPPHAISQDEIRDAALHHFSRGRRDMRRLIPIFNNVNVRQRHLCVPLEWYEREHVFSETNAEYIRWARKLSRQAVCECLKGAGAQPSDVDHLIFVSTSGLSTPSIDAHLINELGFSSGIRRTPVFGLGCAGGAAGLSRQRDLCRVPGQECVLLVTVELCSLTFQFRDFSKANLVASSLFSDGAAAVLMTRGDFSANGAPSSPTPSGRALQAGTASSQERPAPQDAPARQDSSSPCQAGRQEARVRARVLATCSTIFPDTMDVMGWDFSENGLGVIFSRRIPQLIGRHIRENITTFLKGQGLGLEDISHFLVHPGGAKILQVLAQVLELSPQRLKDSRWVLENYGNMSSPTLIFIIDRFQRLSPPSRGEYGLAAAFGPGFSSELLLLQW